MRQRRERRGQELIELGITIIALGLLPL